jgi:hypothetical protein
MYCNTEIWIVIDIWLQYHIILHLYLMQTYLFTENYRTLWINLSLYNVIDYY